MHTQWRWRRVIRHTLKRSNHAGVREQRNTNSPSSQRHQEAVRAYTVAAAAGEPAHTKRSNHAGFREQRNETASTNGPSSQRQRRTEEARRAYTVAGKANTNGPCSQKRSRDQEARRAHTVAAGEPAHTTVPSRTDEFRAMGRGLVFFSGASRQRSGVNSGTSPRKTSSRTMLRTGGRSGACRRGWWSHA